MARIVRNVEHWLSELGKARAAGVMSSPQAGGPLPWQTGQPVGRAGVGRSSSHRRAAWGIAAAAGVGFVLIGVWRLEPLWTPSIQPNAVHTMALASRDIPLDHATTTETLAALPKFVSPTTGLAGDYNGDGRVDGEDIQFFLNQQAQKSKGEVEKDASDFARRLLGS